MTPGVTHEIAAEAQPASRSAFSLEKGVFFRALVMAVGCNSFWYIQSKVNYTSAQKLSTREHVAVIQPKFASEISCVAPALIRALWAQVQSLMVRVAALEAKLNEPLKTPDNSSLPPSKGQKPDKPEKANRIGPRQGSLGRKGGGRPLACDPDETVTAKAVTCLHCQAALTDADQVLHGRYDKVDLPVVRPVVTRVDRYAGHCPCCGGVTLAPVPAGLEDGSPFSVNIVALAIYLRFTHAIASSWSSGVL
jgi:hypothetical protein